ncbi:hypothetical protein WN093_12930 [Gammaproteobacteria bacterium AS21]
MKECIKCNSEIDFLADTFTFYQVDGVRYIYCAVCKNPNEPYISPNRFTALNEEVDFFHKKLRRNEKMWMIISIIGVGLGYFIGTWLSSSAI